MRRKAKAQRHYQSQRKAQLRRQRRERRTIARDLNASGLPKVEMQAPHSPPLKLEWQRVAEIQTQSPPQTIGVSGKSTEADPQCSIQSLTPSGQ